MHQALPKLLTGLAPVLFPDTQILILGSFPGAASLAASQYYAHPRNQFWPLISAVLNDELASLPYLSRLQRLTQHRVGLWDVIEACKRSGSLDSAIREAQDVDFSLLQQRCPALHTIAFNGKTSGKAALRFAGMGLRTLVLPSSSPANAQLSFEEKLVQWRSLNR